MCGRVTVMAGWKTGHSITHGPSEGARETGKAQDQKARRQGGGSAAKGECYCFHQLAKDKSSIFGVHYAQISTRYTERWVFCLFCQILAYSLEEIMQYC